MAAIRPGALDPARPLAAVPPGDPGDPGLAESVARCLNDFFTARRGAADPTDPRFDGEVVARLERFTLLGGKRIRPTFAWWGWRAGGGPGSGPGAAAALRAVSALELIQSCALIQDDVMDGSPTRRGQPALHREYAEAHRSGSLRGSPRRYGESVAVLAGDLALAWADDMLDDALDGTDRRARVRAPWRAMRTEMIAGQFLDLHAQAQADVSEPTALRVARLKTAAYSVERPLEFGAALAGAGSGAVAALRSYGSDVGTAYQLRDDLLGVYGDPAATGKPIGDDIREGKPTLLLAIGLRRARERGDPAAADTLRGAVGDPGLTDADVRAVGALLDDLAARSAVEAHMRALLDSGLAHLAGAPFAATARDALTALAGHAVARLR
ncbi:geranylgeranyl diphosphate synthase type I [Murinocardiopsis flavida]|uniref:Geranylgeranyl diphosphate synthase type I n=1 Tax=Murinocardiopsis flavida TaxID=645275 RepID=A0A2P8DKM1_9ACTN|nr:polyprenyl synthetase family protein [Murinocardiopsis flavida]PSK97749.1 geranylgeranyl diphosphate synthase type I [Murinocardiopsis flavida]